MPYIQTTAEASLMQQYRIYLISCKRSPSCVGQQFLFLVPFARIIQSGRLSVNAGRIRESTEPQLGLRRFFIALKYYKTAVEKRSFVSL